MIRSIILFILLLLAHTDARGEFVAVPPRPAPITDQTGILGHAKQQLEQKILTLKQERGSEVAVLVIPTTQPETIEQYSIRVVDEWKLGRKGVDDGVLLLVALKDRTVRIEVGRGLEGDIPDLKAHRIINEQIIPRFKAGTIEGGISAGVDSIISLIRGAQLPPPFRKGKKNRIVLNTVVVLTIVVFIVILIVSFWIAVQNADLTDIVGSYDDLRRRGRVSIGSRSSHEGSCGPGGGSFDSGSTGSSSGFFDSGSFGSGGSFSGGGASGEW